MGGDGFTKIKAKRGGQCRVPIACGMCGKTCPAFVIIAGAKPGGTPAVCLADGCSARLSVKKARAALDDPSAAAAPPGPRPTKKEKAARSLCDDLQAKLAAKTKENANLQAKLHARSSGDVDMDACPDASLDSSASLLKAAISDAVEELQALEKSAPKLRSLFPAGCYDQKIAEAKQKVNKAQADKRAANPIKVRLDGAASYRDKMGKVLTEARSEAEDLQDQLKELQASIAVQAAAIDTAAADLASAEAEVADLAAQYAAEKSQSVAMEASPATLVAPSDDLALQEAVDKAVAASLAKWEQEAFRLREVAAAACAERDQILAEALARFQKDQDEVDAEDDASVVDTDSEPAAKRQREKDKKAAVVAKRRDIKRRFDEDVQKAHLKVKK